MASGVFESRLEANLPLRDAAERDLGKGCPMVGHPLFATCFDFLTSLQGRNLASIRVGLKVMLVVKLDESFDIVRHAGISLCLRTSRRCLDPSCAPLFATFLRPHQISPRCRTCFSPCLDLFFLPARNSPSAVSYVFGQLQQDLWSGSRLGLFRAC